MEHLKIVINSTADAKAGKGLVEDLKIEQVKESKDITIGILENGTANGQAVLMILLKNDDGTFSMGQITGNHLCALWDVYKGALHRFELEKAAGN